jgi:hypothetical protein
MVASLTEHELNAVGERTYTTFLVDRDSTPRGHGVGMFSLIVGRTFTWFVGREAISAFNFIGISRAMVGV